MQLCTMSSEEEHALERQRATGHSSSQAPGTIRCLAIYACGSYKFYAYKEVFAAIWHGRAGGACQSWLNDASKMLKKKKEKNSQRMAP